MTVIVGMIDAMVMVMADRERASVLMAVAIVGSTGAGSRVPGARRQGAEMVGEQIREDVVGTDAQQAGRDLGRRVTVAEMPGDAAERQRVGGGDLEDGFGSGTDLDQGSVVEGEESPSRSTRASGRSRRKWRPSSVARRRRRRWRSSKARVTVGGRMASESALARRLRGERVSRWWLRHEHRSLREYLRTGSSAAPSAGPSAGSQVSSSPSARTW